MGGKVFNDVTPFDYNTAQSILLKLNNIFKNTRITLIPVGSFISDASDLYNDLDIFIDVEDVLLFGKTDKITVAKKILSEFIQSYDIETKNSGITIHAKVEINGSYHQVDLMLVLNANVIKKFHIHNIPKNSPYKGANKHIIMALLAREKGMLWSPWQGLYKRNEDGTKGEFITNDLSQIAKYLIHEHAYESDLSCVENILNSFPDRSKTLLNSARLDKNWKEKINNYIRS